MFHQARQASGRIALGPRRLCVHHRLGRAPGGCPVRASAQEKTAMVVKEALKVGVSAVETASGWVPESVPRPAAKALVAVGGAVVFGWIFQKVLSTVITVGLLVGGAYLWISASGKDQPSSRSDSSSGGDDSEDPVAAARRIMDKYK